MELLLAGPLLMELSKGEQSLMELLWVALLLEEPLPMVLS